MKPILARIALIVVLIWLARSYSPFGEGSFTAELLNLGLFVIAFALVDRLITAKLR